MITQECCCGHIWVQHGGEKHLRRAMLAACPRCAGHYARSATVRPDPAFADLVWAHPVSRPATLVNWSATKDTRNNDRVAVVLTARTGKVEAVFVLSVSTLTGQLQTMQVGLTKPYRMPMAMLEPGPKTLPGGLRDIAESIATVHTPIRDWNAWLAERMTERNA